MPVLFERTRPTKQQLRAVFAHIRRRREKEKAETEAKRAKEEEEKKKKEQEARKSKEKLEDVAKQIEVLEAKLVSLKEEKHDLFAQLKKDLLQKQEDENRKRTQFSTALYNPAGAQIAGPKGFAVPCSVGPSSAVLFPGTSAVSGSDDFAGSGNAKHPISPASHNIAQQGPSGLPITIPQSQQMPSGRYTTQYLPQPQGQTSSSVQIQSEGHYGTAHQPTPGIRMTTDMTSSQTGNYYPGPRGSGHGNAGQEQFGRLVVQSGIQPGQNQSNSQGGNHDPDQLHDRQGPQAIGSHANQDLIQDPCQTSIMEQSHSPYGRSLSKTSRQHQGYITQQLPGQQHASSHLQSYQSTQQGTSQHSQPLLRDYHGQQYSHGQHSVLQHPGRHQLAHGQDHSSHHPPAQVDKQVTKQQIQSSVHLQQTSYPGLQTQNLPVEQQQQIPQAHNYQSQHGYQQDQVSHQQKYQHIQQSYHHSLQQRSQQQVIAIQGRENQYDKTLHQQAGLSNSGPLPGKKQESSHGGHTGQPSAYNHQYMTQQEYGDQHHSQGSHSSKRSSHRYNPYSVYQGSKGHYQGTSKKHLSKYSQGPSHEETAQGSTYGGSSSRGQPRHYHQSRENRPHKSDASGNYSSSSVQQHASKYYS